MKHNCIALRLATSGGVYAWELNHAGRAMELRVSVYPMLNAALDGCGLAFVTGGLAGRHVREGRLLSVMADWCPCFPGLYCPSRRHASRALALVIDAIRYKD